MTQAKLKYSIKYSKLTELNQYLYILCNLEDYRLRRVVFLASLWVWRLWIMLANSICGARRRVDHALHRFRKYQSASAYMDNDCCYINITFQWGQLIELMDMHCAGVKYLNLLYILWIYLSWTIWPGSSSQSQSYLLYPTSVTHYPVFITLLSVVHHHTVYCTVNIDHNKQSFGLDSYQYNTGQPDAGI